jgi:hypothetical protein
MAPQAFKPSRDRAVFAALLSGAYASAGVALLFLALDAFRGDPFLTPSLLGSTILLGMQPAADLPVRLDMVALYSLVHLAAFVALGAAATVATIRFAALRRSAIGLPLLLFGVLAVGELLVSAALPGLVDAIGLGRVTLANAAAAWIMGRIVREALEGKDMLSLIDAVSRVTGSIS